MKLLTFPEPPEWMVSTACSQSDPEMFFPVPGGNGGSDAKGVCSNCPVRVPCLAYALEENIPDGIWGGLTGRERQRLLRRKAS